MHGWFGLRRREVERFERFPIQTQQRMLVGLLTRGAGTDFGRRYEIDRIGTIEEFQSRIPLSDYDSFSDYVKQMLDGERDVTVRGRVKLFARSSGTTSDRSKYIPLTRRGLWNDHLRGMRDVVTLYLAACPYSHVLEGKTLTLGGSCFVHNGATIGDLSALLMLETRAVSGWFRLPEIETALLPDFDEKVERICRECTGRNVTSFAGVPSWNLALMRRVLEYTGRDDLHEVWPGLELFVHGGVGFAPYRKAFGELFPSGDILYMETYNASEGFFAIADDLSRNDMLLMLDYGTFYEFRNGSTVVPLEGVECGRNYSMVITTSNGLWRYELGDTVEFTSTSPYRIRITGRTRQFINAFGEELMLDNAERAVATVCTRTGAVVEEFTVAPRYMGRGRKGAHEWVVEFSRRPDDPVGFARELDEELMMLNSDYEAKRRSTMDPLSVVEVPRGTFRRWLAAKGKNKVPHLSNDRRTVDDVMGFAKLKL